MVRGKLAARVSTLMSSSRADWTAADRSRLALPTGPPLPLPMRREPEPCHNWYTVFAPA